jgi:hypothetical protein
MYRMGHATVRAAALMYQHASSARDHEIARAIDERIASQRRKPETGACYWHAERIDLDIEIGPGAAIMPSAWALGRGAGDGNRTRTISLEGRRRQLENWVRLYVG